MITNDNIKNRHFFLCYIYPRHYGSNSRKIKWRHLLHYPKNDNILATNLAKISQQDKGLKKL